MVTIVYAHPYDKSFNHAILQAVTKELSDNGRSYNVINLYDENFNPVLGVNDLALFSKGQTTDQLVRNYQKILQQTNEIIFIFPIWWGMMPAILKGFIDKTFLKGEIYDTSPEGLMLPCLSIDKTTVITTSQQETAVIAPFIEGYFGPLVLNTVGMNNLHWHNCPRTATGSPAHRQEFLAEVLKELAA